VVLHGDSLDRARRRTGDPCRIGTGTVQVLRRSSPERGYGARVRACDDPAVRGRLRAVFCALLVAAVASALSACGGNDAQGSDDAATRTIVDADGTKVEVPALPQRVVTLGEATLDGALAVGLRPIATAGGRGQGGISSYLAKPARGVIDVGVLGRPNLEHVAALEPDLIVVDDTAVHDGAMLEQMRRLAPTVRVSKAGQDWRAAFTVEADALNRQKEGAHVLHEFDVRVRQVRDALGANAGALDGSTWLGAGGPIAQREVLDDVARALTSG
jgi:iron complex transport system substrate-binding protein